MIRSFLRTQFEDFSLRNIRAWLDAAWKKPWQFFFKRRLVGNRPSHTLFFWILGTFLFALVPHLVELPVWITTFVLVSLALRSYMELRPFSLPSLIITFFLACVVFGAVLVQYQTFLGREAGTTLVSGLMAVLFFEMRSHREATLLPFCCLFVIMSTMLVTQTLELFLYDLLVVALVLSCLFRVYCGDFPQQHSRAMLRRSGLILLQAAPLTLLFFFAVPRYPGKLELQLGSTSIGLTDHLQPGSIARLTENDDNALRVVFTGPPPATSQLYWRALVLTDYHRNVWSVGPDQPDSAPVRVVPGHPIFHQKIMLWPNDHNWLIALDCPVNTADAPDQPGWSNFRVGHVLQLSDARAILNQKVEYETNSAFEVTQTSCPREEMVRALALRDADRAEIDPRVLALVQRLQAENPTLESYSKAILTYFRTQGFSYTLSPGTYSNNFLGEFLFDRKVGYCEHFACAYGVLMRLAHYPVRLIAGYVGATYNSYGNFYLVRQANAHAWAEFWDEAKQHWTRVDPTTAVGSSSSGTLVESLTDQHDSEISVQVANHRFVMVSAMNSPPWLRQALRDLQQRRQQFEAAWDDFVLSYDADAQLELVKKMGFSPENRVVLVGVCILGVAIFGFIFYLVQRVRTTLTPVEKQYRSLCRTLARGGLAREPWEGPLAYTERAAKARPDLAPLLREIGRLLTLYRYARPQEFDLSHLQAEFKILTRQACAGR